jgi:hypothetical protein
VDVGGGADQQRQIGHGVEPDRLEHDPVHVDQGETLIVLPDGGGPALDDVDDERVGQPPRHPGVADPAEPKQALPGRLEVHERHRRGRLVEGDVVDVDLADMVGALDLDVVQREAGLADAFAERSADHLGDPKRPHQGTGQGDHHSQENPPAQPPHRVGKRRGGRRRPAPLAPTLPGTARRSLGLAASCRAAGDRLAHIASSTIFWTSSA